MARIRIDLPNRYQFKDKLRIRVTDINYGGHLGNDAVLGLVHELRVRFLTSVGLSEKDMKGPGLMMVDSAIQYKGQGQLGDKLCGRLTVTRMDNYGFEIIYMFENEDHQEIARAQTNMICFNYETNRMAPLPESAKALLLKKKEKE